MKHIMNDFKFLFSFKSVAEFDYCNFGGSYVLKTNVNSPALNLVITDSVPSDLVIDEVKAYFGKIPFIWWVDRNTTNSSEILCKHSFKKVASITGMHLDLTHLIQLPFSHDIVIEQVVDFNTLTKWIEVCAQASDMPFDIVEQFIRPIFSQTKNTIFYIGYYKGIPVGTSTIIEIENEVAVCNVAVLPEYRKKGIGYALTYIPLQKMYNAGKTVAILQASDMAVSLYKKMGFKEHAIFDAYMV